MIMFGKWFKMGLLVVVILCVIGGLLFGGDLVSYVRSTIKSVQRSVKDAVPIEFELKRARDTLEQIIPEMHANIRLIAQEEVEVAALNSDIEKSQKALADERMRIARLRKSLDVQPAVYTFAGRTFTRTQVKQDLAQRFERFKEAELVLASKQKLLERRQSSLHAAMQMLEQTRAQKRLLHDKIGALESQYRVVKAAAVGSQIDIDNSKLAQTAKLIDQIKRRLDVAERVLAHESRFVQSIPVDAVPEEDLLAQIDEYFAPTDQQKEVSVAKESDIAGSLPEMSECH
jgi:chromosome segregation ATPase